MQRIVAPIERERPAVQDSIDVIKTQMTKFLKAQKTGIIEQVIQSYEKINKVDDAGIVASLTIDWSELVKPLAENLVSMALDGAIQASIQITLTDDVSSNALSLVNDKAVAWANDRAAELVGMKWVDGELVENPNVEWCITQSTRDMIRRDVTEAIQDGLSNNELADTLEENYAFSAERAEVIARTETAFADMNGNMLTYKEAKKLGIDIKKKWHTAGDASVSQDCIDNSNQGAIDLGIAFQSGAQMPPDHPNCRCTILPIIDEDQQSYKLDDFFKKR